MAEFGLFEMLRILKRNELKKFRAFVKNEQFNKDSNCIRLLEYVAPFYPDFDSPALSQEYIFVKVFGRKGKLSHVHVINSRVKRLLETFLVMEEVQNNRVTQREILISLLSNRGVQKPLQKLISQTRAYHEKSPDRSLDYISKKLSLDRQQMELTIHEESRGKKFDVSPLIEVFEQYTSLYRLIFSVAVVNASNVVAQDVSLPQVDNLLDAVKQNEFYKLRPIEVYHHMLIMLKDQSYEHFRSAVKLIHQCGEELPKKERVFLFTTCANFCVARWQRGDEKAMQELFDIYQKMMETDALFTGEYMPPGRFKNIVIVGLRLKAFNWVENFVLENKNCVPNKFIKGNYLFCTAAIAFYKENYDKTIEILANLRPLDFYYQMTCRLFLAKAYFLKSESFALHNYLGGFKSYTEKSKLLTAKYKSSILNFIKFIGKVDSARGKIRNQEELEKLKDKISKASNVNDKLWLIAQLDILLKPTTISS